MNVMTKQGSQDNVVIYEHYCDTTADLANIPKDQINIGSVAIVVNGEDNNINVYIANSQKQWNILDTISGDSGKIDSKTITSAVTTWLADHPDATTTVQNNSISYEKLNHDLQNTIDNKADTEPHNCLYDGRDLSTVFVSAEAFHQAVIDGDFSKIRVGDYWPITLNGAFYDYGTYTVPANTEYFTDIQLTTSGGTTSTILEGQYESQEIKETVPDAETGEETETTKTVTAVKFKVSNTDVYCSIDVCLPYFERTLNDAVVLLEVAGINNYMGYGDAGELAADKPHLTFVSRDCLPIRLRMSKGKGVWEDTDNRTPWLGSALYKTLNDTEHGILKLLGETDIGAYIYVGPNNKGMRANMEVKAAGAGAATGWRWGDRGQLFLPFEAEVFGHGIWSGAFGYSFGCSLQLQLFVGSMRHIAKGVGNGSRHTTWWMASTDCELVDCFCIANNQTLPNSDYGTNAYGVPLCFIVT